MSAGISLMLSCEMVSTRFGPGDVVKREKSSPNDTPRPKTEATKATPNDADS